MNKPTPSEVAATILDQQFQSIRNGSVDVYRPGMLTQVVQFLCGSESGKLPK